MEWPASMVAVAAVLVATGADEGVAAVAGAGLVVVAVGVAFGVHANTVAAAMVTRRIFFIIGVEALNIKNPSEWMGFMTG